MAEVDEILALVGIAAAFCYIWGLFTK